MSEYVIANIINHERKAFDTMEAQQRRHWMDWRDEIGEYRQLSDLTISILGVGDIGKEVARRLDFLGMTVYGMTSKQPTPDTAEPYIQEYFTQERLAEYLQKSDYVCNILPITDKTNAILDKDMLENCATRKTTLINIGRGNVVTNESVLKALNMKWIDGAILDVFPQEPLSQSNELWNTQGVVITPHVSGLSFGKQVAKCFVDNLAKYEAGQQLNYLVSWDKQY